jgi:hypothetical protein
VAFSSNFSAILALAGGGGGEDLAGTLAIGNFTGGNDLVFSASTGDGIDTENNGAGPGYTLDLRGSDAGGGVFTGGDIDLTPGLGSGGGANGVVNINGDLVVTGSIVLSNLITGAGNPEGAVIATIGSIYQRTGGGAGNSVYFKQANTGLNTGWVPAGPHVRENFTSVGVATFITSRAVFDDPLTLGVGALLVYWNGLLQREGAANDYTVVYGGASATITFNFPVIPPPGDFITISYLPE